MAKKKIIDQKSLKKMRRSLFKEIREHRFIYALLLITLMGGYFIRIYRTDKILGFYFDQGRDALKIWDFWHKGDLILIGPTTGIAGIFRGPFYLYLIAPFYLLGGGNPVWPANFLAFTSVLAIVLLYCLGAKIQNRITGLFAAILASFSFYLMLASRWLSNPTPMLLLSMILVWMMVLVNEGKKWGWPIIALVSGMSLFHFGSSGEFFYFPAIGIFFVWQVWKKINDTSRKRGNWDLSQVASAINKTMGKKAFLLSLAAFLFTASPLILFDFLKGHLLSDNIKKFVVEEQSFKASFWEVAKIRLLFYYDVFTSKIFHWIRPRERALLAVVGLGFLGKFRKLIKSDGVKIILLLLVSPMVGLLFFQGNSGNIYDYYLTGYYLIFILIFAIVLGQLWQHETANGWLRGLGSILFTTISRLFVLYFFYVFLTWNWMVTKSKINDGVDGPNSIALRNQRQAVDWVYQDVDGRDFNVDVYVPPVIPHAYDYLFKWRGTKKYGRVPNERQVDLLYTLYEVDPPHPERLQAWLDRQAGIGEVKDGVKFGGIVVQRRVRIYENEN